MNETGLVTREAEVLMPVMSIQTATERYQSIVEYVSKLMNEGADYGKIPGTDKNTLLKPGAEKLCTLFGLSKRFQLVERIEDWNGTEFGDPFFNYIYRCGLYRGDLLIAESDGSCNSRETKYRWRQGERLCPGCGKGTIIKGKEEYGGGWLCFAKKGGCGAKFSDTDERITGQQVGRVANPDVADQVNTMQKMAQKRALIAATLLAVNASEFFTQDMEDFAPLAAGGNGAEKQEPEKKPEPKRNPRSVHGSPSASKNAERDELVRAVTDAANILNSNPKHKINLWTYVNQEFAVEQGLGDLGVEQLRKLIKDLSGKVDAMNAESRSTPTDLLTPPADDDVPF